MATFSLLMDAGDVEKFTTWMDGMERRAVRAELLPILQEHLQPLVSAEKAILSSHSITGALEESLMARAGGGDRAGTISTFSTPTAASKQLQARWARGRKQQRKWAAGLEGKRGRSRVFYGIFVHQGHEIVVHGKDTGKRTKPIPFAAEAVESLGDSESEAAATALLQHIIGD